MPYPILKLPIKSFLPPLPGAAALLEIGVVRLGEVRQTQYPSYEMTECTHIFPELPLLSPWQLQEEVNTVEQELGKERNRSLGGPCMGV